MSDTALLEQLRKRVLGARIDAAHQRKSGLYVIAYNTVIDWIDELLPPTPLPCPFCTNDLAYIINDNYDHPQEYAYECPTDGCIRGPWRRTEAEALLAWNTRGSGVQPNAHE